MLYADGESISHLLGTERVRLLTGPGQKLPLPTVTQLEEVTIRIAELAKEVEANLGSKAAKKKVVRAGPDKKDVTPAFEYDGRQTPTLVGVPVLLATSWSCYRQVLSPCFECVLQVAVQYSSTAAPRKK